MKDFDEARAARASRDRRFTIGGEEFTTRVGVRPEAIIEFSEMTDETTAVEAFRIIDTLILDFTEPDGHERWKALRERTEDPVTLVDLKDLAAWIVGEQAGRPTSGPSLSTPGPEPSGTGSTGNSSLRAVEG